MFGNASFLITLFYNISRKLSSTKEKGSSQAIALISLTFSFFWYDFSILNMCKDQRTLECAVCNE